MLLKLVALFALVAVVSASDSSTTTPKPLEGHNVDSVKDILTDKEKFTNYLGCVLNKAPCNPSSQRLKVITQNALAEECSKCDAKQKELLAQMSAFVSTTYPAEWEQMLELFDPTKAHRKSIDELVAAGKAMAASTTPKPATVKT